MFCGPSVAKLRWAFQNLHPGPVESDGIPGWQPTIRTCSGSNLGFWIFGFIWLRQWMVYKCSVILQGLPGTVLPSSHPLHTPSASKAFSSSLHEAKLGRFIFIVLSEGSVLEDCIKIPSASIWTRNQLLHPQEEHAILFLLASYEAWNCALSSPRQVQALHQAKGTGANASLTWQTTKRIWVWSREPQVWYKKYQKYASSHWAVSIGPPWNTFPLKLSLRQISYGVGSRHTASWLDDYERDHVLCKLRKLRKLRKLKHLWLSQTQKARPRRDQYLRSSSWPLMVHSDHESIQVWNLHSAQSAIERLLKSFSMKKTNI